MASTSVSWVLFLLQLVTLAASARAATFLITNNCGFTVWPAAIPVDGGLELGQGQTWTVDVPSGTSNGQIWGRTGCSFNGGSGSCKTGDCGGALRCTSSGQPPRTLAEFDIEASGGGGGYDYYDISVVDGYNLPMAFSCTTGVSVNCGGSSCPDAHRNDNDVRTTTHVCPGNSNYKVTFCP